MSALTCSESPCISNVELAVPVYIGQIDAVLKDRYQE